LLSLSTSAGILTLLQNGAKPVRSGWDVLCEFERRFPGRLHEKSTAAPAAAAASKPAPSAPVPSVSEEKSVDKTDSAGYIDLREQLSGLNEDQLKIVTAIEEGGSHVDDIIEATGLSTARVLSQLTVLQIKGFVRAEAGRRVVLNIQSKK
jgi:predicted Rossmann fold nucleotide-binding protein DprA/Smf involved in DNA uptake